MVPREISITSADPTSKGANVCRQDSHNRLQLLHILKSSIECGHKALTYLQTDLCPCTIVKKTTTQPTILEERGINKTEGYCWFINQLFISLEPC
ncbi:hypothetical protein DOY81_011730, partial [Sarcophaga bullata]